MMATVIQVPREGFRPELARRLLGQPEEGLDFTRAVTGLPYGEWRMIRGVLHVMLPGMRSLAKELAVEDVEFEPEPAAPGARGPRHWMTEWERKQEELLS